MRARISPPWWCRLYRCRGRQRFHRVCASNPVTVVGLQEEPLSAESRRYINLPNRPANLPFSDAVLVGDTLYISGRIGLDLATGEAPESIDAEIELLFEGFQAVLREAGMTMDDLVWVQVYSPDVSCGNGSTLPM